MRFLFLGREEEGEWGRGDMLGMCEARPQLAIFVRGKCATNTIIASHRNT